MHLLLLLCVPLVLGDVLPLEPDLDDIQVCL